MPTLRQKEAERNKKLKEIRILSDEIDAIKEKRVIPKIRAKYEGKYWKYDNGYSLEERWPLYCFCLQVVSENEGLFDSFETGPSHFQFKINEQSSFHLCETEITKKEYLKAANKFIEFSKILANDL